MKFKNNGPWQPIYGISVFEEDGSIRNLQELRAIMVEKVFKACEGNIKNTVAETGISRSSLYRIFSKEQQQAWFEQLPTKSKHKRNAEPSQDTIAWDDFQAMVIDQVISICDGNINQIATKLKIGRTTLYRHIGKEGIEKAKKLKDRRKLAAKGERLGQKSLGKFEKTEKGAQNLISILLFAEKLPLDHKEQNQIKAFFSYGFGELPNYLKIKSTKSRITVTLIEDLVLSPASEPHS